MIRSWRDQGRRLCGLQPALSYRRLGVQSMEHAWESDRKWQWGRSPLFLWLVCPQAQLETNDTQFNFSRCICHAYTHLLLLHNLSQICCLLDSSLPWQQLKNPKSSEVTHWGSFGFQVLWAMSAVSSRNGSQPETGFHLDTSSFGFNPSSWEHCLVHFSKVTRSHLSLVQTSNL